MISVVQHLERKQIVCVCVLHPILGKFTQVQFAILFKNQHLVIQEVPISRSGFICVLSGRRRCLSLHKRMHVQPADTLAGTKRERCGGWGEERREGERHSERERQTDKQTDRQTDRQRQRDRDRHTGDRQRQTERERETGTGGNENKTRGGENLLIAVFSDCPSA